MLNMGVVRCVEEIGKFPHTTQIADIGLGVCACVGYITRHVLRQEILKKLLIFLEIWHVPLGPLGICSTSMNLFDTNLCMCHSLMNL